MKGAMFKIIMNGNEVYCDGKTITSYSPNRRIQINDYEESKGLSLRPRYVSMYKDGYSYQIEEKKVYNGKNVTVIEMAPQNRKVSFFKIDVAIEDALMMWWSLRSMKNLVSDMYIDRKAQYE
jgi:outer membrane lipoprotein-sorting protein